MRLYRGWEGGGGTSVRVRLAVKLNQYIQQSLLTFFNEGVDFGSFSLSTYEKLHLRSVFRLFVCCKKALNMV